MNEEDTTIPTNEPADLAPEGTETVPPPIPERATTLASTTDDLLKHPASVLAGLRTSHARAIAQRLLLLLGGCLAVFGAILGLSSGHEQHWLAPLKVVFGVVASGLITLPSLYIFSCLNGLDVTLRSVAGILLACLGLVGLLLVGLAPVLWIFTQSTDSLPFLGGLALVFWLGSLGFGLTLIFRIDVAGEAKSRFYLHVWALIFVLVTLQMSTALRPIVGRAVTILPQEKKFFLTHWIDQIGSPESGQEGR